MKGCLLHAGNYEHGGRDRKRPGARYCYCPPPHFFTSMRCSIDPMANCHAFGSQLTKVAQSGWTVGHKAALRSFGNFACHSLVRRFSSWKLHTPGCDIGI